MSLPRVLIVEDEHALSLALAAAVRQVGAVSELAPTAAQARRKLEEAESGFSAMILDIGLPDQNGLVFWENLPQEDRPPAIVITAHGELDRAIFARKLGVVEFFHKPLEFDAFKVALDQLIGRWSQPDPAPSVSAAYIGAAPAMRPVFQQIAHACASQEPVLISGETGTGKTLTAELIQRNSLRPGRDAITLRPSSGNQVEELGGALDRSAGGILILDDIGDLSPDAQTLLVQRWDAGAEPFARILAISGVNLREEVEAGRFRTELFYRLQVLELRLPPLRERIGDLMALFSFFLAQLRPGLATSVDPETLRQLEVYPWPGNLRELRNVASYAVTVNCGARSIAPAHLPEHIINQGESSPATNAFTQLQTALDEWLAGAEELPCYRELSEDLERLLIKQLLVRFDGKLARMASALGANRTTLRKKLRE